MVDIGAGADPNQGPRADQNDLADGQNLAHRYSATDLALLLAPDPASALLPTAQQQRVIEAPLEPLLVIAGAGSGKTATMASRVVYLVANGFVRPEEVLGLTFTRKAAGELAMRIRGQLERLDHALNPAGAPSIIQRATFQPTISTYHSYAARLVGDHALRIGRNPQSRLLGSAGLHQLAETLVLEWSEDLTIDYAPSTIISSVLELDSQLSEHGCTPEQVHQYADALIADMHEKNPGKRSRGPKAAAREVIASLSARRDLLRLVTEYRFRKRSEDVIDYGDQVRLAAQIASDVPKVGELERAQYRVVLLDEYQDTSIAQVDMLSALFGGGHPVTAVGDPNQAIYGWRGAAAGTLLDFPQTFCRVDADDADTASLTTAWRNSEQILIAANQVASSLRSDGVEPLTPRPKVSQGNVTGHFALTARDEATHIAKFIKGLGIGGDNRTAAVICRQRRQFEPVAQALREAHVPYTITGVAGLLHLPAVQDVWRTLQVLAEPTNGTALMRLFSGPYVRLGAADLVALWQWVRRLDQDEPALADAMTQLPPRGWTDQRGREVSDTARERITWLGQTLNRLREQLNLPLAELVAQVPRMLGLDIELLSTEEQPGRALAHLEEFTAVAAQYAAENPVAGLTGFLSWLDAAVEHEAGLPIKPTEPEPGAVQLTTVHAAKGLEWDVVVVVGMNDGDFPSMKTVGRDVKDSGWLKDISTLPYDLRGDSENLPILDVSAPEDFDALDESIGDFRLVEGSRLVAEERRLAYVALTRAREVLHLSGSTWSGRATANEPSPFLSEVARALNWEETWRVPNTLAANPEESLADESWWPRINSPRDETTESRQRSQTGPTLRGAAAPHPNNASAGSTEADPTEPRVVRTDADHAIISRLQEQADMLLAERSRPHRDAPAIEHLSASAVVALTRDPVAFRRDSLRPIPRQPSVVARRGTEFHRWVEEYFGARSLLEWQELPGFADELQPADPTQLVAAFRKSQWAQRNPVALEVDIETVITGVSLRCRIDAVFASDRQGHLQYTVVDWKTGAPAGDQREAHAREQQLLLYRIAWARYADVPLEDVNAAFHYITSNRTVNGGEGDISDIAELLNSHRSRWSVGG